MNEIKLQVSNSYNTKTKINIKLQVSYSYNTKTKTNNIKTQ